MSVSDRIAIYMPSPRELFIIAVVFYICWKVFMLTAAFWVITITLLGFIVFELAFAIVKRFYK